jgi:hypothetical protein
VVLPTPPLGLASVMTRNRDGCLGAMWYLLRDGMGWAAGRPENLGKVPTLNLVPSVWYHGLPGQARSTKIFECREIVVEL